MEPWKRNLYVSWIIQILSLTGFGIVLPFLPFYIQELGVTDAAELKIWVGIMSSAPALAMGVMAPVWGLLSDRFGRRIMLLRAMGFGVLVLAGLAFAQSVQAVLVLRLAQGMFTGTIAASATLIAAGTPRERLSYALGFLSSSTFIGFSLGPLVGGVLVELVGYRATFLVGAGILVVGFVMVLAFIREAESHHTEAQQESPSFSSRSILTLSFVSLFVLLFCLRFSRSVAMPFLPLVVQAARGTLEGTPVVVGGISAATGLVTAVSGITLARLGDRWNKRALMTVLLGIGCLVSGPLFFARNLVVLIGPYVVPEREVDFPGGVSLFCVPGKSRFRRCVRQQVG